MKKSSQQFKVFSRADISRIKGGKKDQSRKMKTNETAAMDSGADFCPPPEPDDQ